MLEYKSKCVECCSDNQYGIDVFEDGMLVRSVSEITENRSDIEKLADLCNEMKIELCHLDDIIEDYLTDFCV